MNSHPAPETDYFQDFTLSGLPQKAILKALRFELVYKGKYGSIL